MHLYIYIYIYIYIFKKCDSVLGVETEERRSPKAGVIMFVICFCAHICVVFMQVCMYVCV